MAASPIPGPAGLFDESVPLRLCLDSRHVGWRGAFFATMELPREGDVDHGHPHHCLQRTRQSLELKAWPDTSWNVVPPRITVWQPGGEQRGSWRGGNSLQFLFISNEHVARVLDDQPRRMPGKSGYVTGSRVLELIFDALDADLSQGSPAGPLVGDGLITAMIGQLCSAPEPTTFTLRATWRARVLEYIDANLSRPLTLAELASEAGVGERQFCRTFRASTGESPHQFVLRRRVERAKALIARGAPLSDVALSSGFADQSQLTRTFSRCVGMTPGGFRMSLRR